MKVFLVMDPVLLSSTVSLCRTLSSTNICSHLRLKTLSGACKDKLKIFLVGINGLI